MRSYRNYLRGTSSDESKEMQALDGGENKNRSSMVPEIGRRMGESVRIYF